jgi:hypothetical protein
LEHKLLSLLSSHARVANATLLRHTQRRWNSLRHDDFFGSDRKKPMTFVTKILVKLGILTEDLDYYFVRAAMVIVFLFFGYQKWFDYEAQALIPYISNGPLISWMYPVFGISDSRRAAPAQLIETSKLPRVFQPWVKQK